MKSNNNIIRNFFFAFISGVVLVLLAAGCFHHISGKNNEWILEKEWYIVSSQKITGDGRKISTPNFIPHGWYQTDLPSTVLACLVRNNMYQNPYFGMRLEKIPREQFKVPWWYRKTFTLDPTLPMDYVSIIFEGINYSADIWLNGSKIASKDTLRGAFHIFELDITPWVKEKGNVLAVEVFPPKPGDFTMGFVDWNPSPPDRNMGIWREVKIRQAGLVSLDHPFVETHIDLSTLKKAELVISSEVVNHADREIKGRLVGRIGKISFQKQYMLKPHEKRKIVFTPAKFPELRIKNPRLWWPISFGKPNLYTLSLVCMVGEKVTDRNTICFGIREISDYFNKEGYRGYKINGKKILIRGAGWTDDLMLADDEQKIETQIKYVRHMNLNTIRLEGFWGNREKLYSLADQYGILVMVGWSCQWEWPEHLGGPTDEFGGVITNKHIDLVSGYFRDQVLWLRNHPSIMVWVLGSDLLPRPKLERKYRQILAEIDTTRPALSTCADAVSKVSGPSGVKMSGPYDYVTPNYWYVDKKHGGAFGFNTETGPGPQPPPVESIKKMIPPDHLWPIDKVWNYHCGRNEFNVMDNYLHAFKERYGESKSVEDFAKWAQVVNYEAIRPMFEAFRVRKFYATGVIQWMLNSAWPETFWQLYDWYLLPNGAFYGTKTACKPLHLVYDYGNNSIYLVNGTLEQFDHLKAEIKIFNFYSKKIFQKTFSIKIGENLSKKIFEIPKLDLLTTVYFLDLSLKSLDGTTLDRNFYWLSKKKDILDYKNHLWYVTPNKSFADFTPLRNLSKVKIEVRHSFIDMGSNQEVKVTLENPTDKIVFFIELRIVNDKTNQSILPILWDDNYISLLPGERRIVHGRYNKADLKGGKPVLKYNGINLED